MILLHEYYSGYMHKYAMKYIKILKANKIGYKIVSCNQDGFWDIIQSADLLLFYIGTDDIHLQRLKSVLTVINQFTGVKCFPNFNTSWHLDDKVSQYYLLKVNGFPAVPSNIFWDKDLALDYTEKAEYSIIFKLKRGAGSSNVCKVEDKKHARRLVESMFATGIKSGHVPGVRMSTIFNSDWKRIAKSTFGRILAESGLRTKPHHALQRERGYAYFQDFLIGNEHDVRVTIIGDRAFAFRRFNRKNDFRSSGSGIIDHDPAKIDLSVVSLAFNVSKTLSFQTMAYDFLQDSEGNWRILEICHLFADWAVFQCPGYWDRDLEWHEGHYWPQYSELVNLLGRDDLIQPDFDIYKGRNLLVEYRCMHEV